MTKLEIAASDLSAACIHYARSYVQYSKDQSNEEKYTRYGESLVALRLAAFEYACVLQESAKNAD